MSHLSRNKADRRRLYAIAAACLLGILLVAAPQSSAPVTVPAPIGPAILSFTSGGHALGFGTSFMYVASGDHMLRVELAGGRSVAPVAASAPPAQASPPAESAAPPLARVTYPGVWDGVTVVYEKSADAIVKSSYLLDAGGSPEAIRLRYNRPVRIDGNGDLVIAYERGEMRERAPVAWQDINGMKTPVDAAFRLLAEDEIGFETGGYDRSLPLVIDPAISWSTFIGSSGLEAGEDIAVDSSGNAYVVGYNGSNLTDTKEYFGYAFVAKLNSSGARTWIAKFGGTTMLYPYGIALDGSGNVYVTGKSQGPSWALPYPMNLGYPNWTPGSPINAFAGGVYDIFVAKFDTDGNFGWYTFLGGDSSDEAGWGIAVNGTDLFVGGFTDATWGSPMRTYSGNYDAFVAKLNTSGAYSWHAYLGGSEFDRGYDIAADTSSNTYVTGSSAATWAETPVNAKSGSDDAYVAKLTTNGALSWYTFLGGAGTDVGWGIAENGGNVYVTGYSGSTWGSPVTAHSGFSADAFAARLNSNGGLSLNTFLGGSGTDWGLDIAVDGNGNMYVTGESDAAWGSPYRAYTPGGSEASGADTDAFVAKLSSAGAVTWSMFLGGNHEDLGWGIAVSGGSTYVTGRSFATWDSPLNAYSGESDAYVAKIPESPTLVELVSFEGTGAGGRAFLTWETASETDNAGFHLWRAERGKPYARISTTMIAAQGSPLQGAKYSYQDFDAAPGRVYLYRLEDVDTNGTSRFHGPVTVFMGTIRLLSPPDGFRGLDGVPPAFAWGIGAPASCKIEISPDAEFGRIIASFPAATGAWITDEEYTPTRREWNGLRPMTGVPRVLYWRVRAKILPDVEIVSEPRWMLVR